VAVKDYVAADIAGYADETDDVVGVLTWQELMTGQMARMLWRGADVARLIMLSASVFLLP
jgi:hypothetical protein